MTPEEREMLAELAAQMLATGQGAELTTELAESGMSTEIWSDDAAVAVLFELHGEHCASSGLLDHYVLRPPDGAVIARVVLPLPGSVGPPARVFGREIVVDGVTFGSAPGESVVIEADSGDVLVAQGLRIEAIVGFDPDSGLTRVTGTVTLDDCAPLMSPSDGRELAARAARVLAHQLVGISAAVRAIATAHVLERHQFGRPIGAFQTVRHRLADVMIAETGARELLMVAGPPVDVEVETLIVKAAAGRAALLAVAAAQQVCGAMGFTAEFGLDRYVRRAYLLDSLLGGSEDAEHAFAAHALASGRAATLHVAL